MTAAERRLAEGAVADDPERDLATPLSRREPASTALLGSTAAQPERGRNMRHSVSSRESQPRAARPPAAG